MTGFWHDMQPMQNRISLPRRDTNSTSCPASFAPRSHSFAKISELLFPRRLVETTRTFFAIVLTLLFCSDFCSLNAENLPRQHRAAVRLHDFVDESLDAFFLLHSFSAAFLYDVICLDEDLVVDAVNVCQSMVMADQIPNTVHLCRGQTSVMQKFPNQGPAFEFLMLAVSIAVFFSGRGQAISCVMAATSSMYCVSASICSSSPMVLANVQTRIKVVDVVDTAVQKKQIIFSKISAMVMPHTLNTLKIAVCFSPEKPRRVQGTALRTHSGQGQSGLPVSMPFRSLQMVAPHLPQTSAGVLWKSEALLCHQSVYLLPWQRQSGPRKCFPYTPYRQHIPPSASWGYPHRQAACPEILWQPTASSYTCRWLSVHTRLLRGFLNTLHILSLPVFTIIKRRGVVRTPPFTFVNNFAVVVA